MASHPRVVLEIEALVGGGETVGSSVGESMVEQFAEVLAIHWILAVAVYVIGRHVERGPG